VALAARPVVNVGAPGYQFPAYPYVTYRIGSSVITGAGPQSFN
jgi:hypothetical protein